MSDSLAVRVIQRVLGDNHLSRSDMEEIEAVVFERGVGDKVDREAISALATYVTTRPITFDSEMDRVNLSILWQPGTWYQGGERESDWDRYLMTKRFASNLIERRQRQGDFLGANQLAAMRVFQIMPETNGGGFRIHVSWLEGEARFEDGAWQCYAGGQKKANAEECIREADFTLKRNRLSRVRS